MPPTPSPSGAPTNLMSSRSPSPRGFDDVVELGDSREATPQAQKKKKKKSKKKKTKEASLLSTKDSEKPPPVLCISRNKHWKYISSYHGPWLQLPLELLESLLMLNMNPNTLALPESRRTPSPSLRSDIVSPAVIYAGKKRELPSLLLSPPPSPPPPPPASPVQLPRPHKNFSKPTPPPIDPGVFRSVTTIRRFIDEASDLAVRAASGLSAAALGSVRSASGYGLVPNPWASAQSLSINALGEPQGNGRNNAMSAMRVHRLRALAVQKLAAAYKADEIAASVMVMQGASALDDIAERVLKVDPHDPDARYVHFFHEKIPSRQLAESTTTQVLDELIAAHPQRLEFYRTRGVVHCFRDEYQLAVRDFTHALKEARNARRAKQAHSTASEVGRGPKIKGKKSKKAKVHGQAPPDGTAVPQGVDGETSPLHPSVLTDAPEPIEPQLLFLRGAAYLQNVTFLIEEAILSLEGITKTALTDGTELRLCYIENGRYGGVEIGNPSGPLGARDGTKARAYRECLNKPAFREQINVLLKKSIRDHEKFLSHFDTLDAPISIFTDNLAQRTEYAFLLMEALRPGSPSQPPPMSAPPVFTTYHPLFVESHFSILLSNLLLGDFVNLLPAFSRAATLVDGLEGYPVFLPARSMAQAEFIEVLERLASGWHPGIQPHSLSVNRLGLESCSGDSPGPYTSSRLCINSADWTEGDLPSPCPSGSDGNSPQELDRLQVLAETLDCARMLLFPVAQRQKEKAEKAAADKAGGTTRKKPLSVSIPLHGPRVEIVLAWLGAVHLPELERVA